MKRSRLLFIMGCLLLLVFLTACEPGVSVMNETTIEIRVLVTSGGRSSVVSVTPGESSNVEATGSFVAAVIPSEEWNQNMTILRNYLQEKMKNKNDLTGPQIQEVMKKLQEVEKQLQTYQKASGSACSGVVPEGELGYVTVTQAADGPLVVQCSNSSSVNPSGGE
jgi:hypothetical protein